LKIIDVEPESLAAENGLQPGDEITHINGFPIRDEIDFRFHASDDELELEIVRDGEAYWAEIENETGQGLGIVFETFTYRSCGNNCIFCFVDQNPSGMRQTLYFKDEDFRLSFLHGNYVTLTNISQRDLERIVEQRLSPLYVSVHAVELEARKKLLGIRHDDRLMAKLEFLTQHRIELHVQIVLCPGFNDGPVLEDTVEKLSRFYPDLNSIAIVPLGLTRHREHLPFLQQVTALDAQKVLEWGERQSEVFKQKFDHHLVYLADEFYLMTGKPIPPVERYDNFAQFENGVGMTRSFIEDFEAAAAQFPIRLSVPRSVTLITGTLAAPVLSAVVLPRLQQIGNLSIQLIPVVNQFYGESVTVSGLLTGQDIYHAFKSEKPGELIVLPPNCLNYDRLFLDGWTPEMLATKLNRTVIQGDNDFGFIFE